MISKAQQFRYFKNAVVLGSCLFLLPHLIIYSETSASFMHVEGKDIVDAFLVNTRDTKTPPESYIKVIAPIIKKTLVRF